MTGGVTKKMLCGNQHYWNTIVKIISTLKDVEIVINECRILKFEFELNCALGIYGSVLVGVRATTSCQCRSLFEF